MTVTAHFAAPSPSAPLRTATLNDVLRGLPAVRNDAARAAVAAGAAWRGAAMLPSPSPFDLVLREDVETLSHPRQHAAAAAEARGTTALLQTAAEGGHAEAPPAPASEPGRALETAQPFRRALVGAQQPALSLQLRRAQPLARDHFPRELSGLERERVLRVPRFHPGADWRHLPNEEVLLVDGTRVARLVYMAEHIAAATATEGAAGASGAAQAMPALPSSSSSTTAPSAAFSTAATPTATGAMPPGRAVCGCQLARTQGERQRLRAAGMCRTCTVSRLVPFMCSHTGDANHQWAGAFGRPSGGGGAGARVTTMATTSKQGAILHDREAGRIYSARETARLQGFPDALRLGVEEAVAREGRAPSGGAAVAAAITVAYRAVGNAVPPTFGAALGREMVAAAADTRA